MKVCQIILAEKKCITENIILSRLQHSQSLYFAVIIILITPTVIHIIICGLVLLPVHPPPMRRVDGVVCTGAGALSSSAWVAPISDDSQSEPSAADAAPLNQSGNPSPRPPDMEAFPAAARLVAAPAGPPGHDAAVAPAGGAPVAALSDPPVRAAAILAPAAGAPGPPDPLVCVLRRPPDAVAGSSEP